MSKQVEAIFEAIERCRESGSKPVELRMQSATLWKIEPDLPELMFLRIVTDETIRKGSVQIICK